MARGRELSLDERGQIVGLHEAGLSLNAIAKMKKISRRAVQGVVKKWRCRQVLSGTGVVLVVPGQPRLSTGRWVRCFVFCGEIVLAQCPPSSLSSFGS